MIRTPADLVPLFPYSGHYIEMAGVYFLDDDRSLLSSLYFSGGVSSVHVPLKDVVMAAHRLGASKVVVIHNHPSGDPSLSDTDTRVARYLLKGLHRNQLQLIGYLAVSGSGYNLWDGQA